MSEIKLESNLSVVNCRSCDRPCRKPGVDWALFVEWLLVRGEMGWYDETFEIVAGKFIEKKYRFRAIDGVCTDCHCKQFMNNQSKKHRQLTPGQLRLPI